MRDHFKRWGAVYIIGLLFVSSLLAQFYFQVVVEQETLAQFGVGVFENWQSEFLQLCVDAVIILALKHFWFKKDAEDLERIEAKVDQISVLLFKRCTKRPIQQ